jgi:hypothetical protein
MYVYSYSQQRRWFWNRYNIAWPCRIEPSSDRTVLTTAVCSRYQYLICTVGICIHTCSYPRTVLAAVKWATLFLSAAIKVTASGASCADQDVSVAGRTVHAALLLKSSMGRTCMLCKALLVAESCWCWRETTKTLIQSIVAEHFWYLMFCWPCIIVT